MEESNVVEDLAAVLVHQSRQSHHPAEGQAAEVHHLQDPSHHHQLAEAAEQVEAVHGHMDCHPTDCHPEDRRRTEDRQDFHQKDGHQDFHREKSLAEHVRPGDLACSSEVSVHKRRKSLECKDELLAWVLA